MTTSFVQRGTEIIKAAVEQDNLDELETALHLYSRGIEFLMTGMKYEKNVRVVAAIREKVNKYLERAEDIKNSINNNNNNNNKKHHKRRNKKQRKNPKNHQNTNKNTNDNDNESKTDDDSGGGSDGSDDEDKLKLQGTLCQAIVREKPNIKWEDIGGLMVAKSLLQETVILPIRFPQLFKGKRKPLRGILLYGPPGTGKSYLAKAVATEAKNSTFFSVSSADLVSKYVGESAKLVRELYEMSRREKPSIIFIDEIDSLVTKRGDNEQSSSRSIKTEFLVQMEGVGKSMKGVLTLGATNCPWDLDPAIRRRFGKRIYIPLPDKQARKQMFKLHVGGNDNDNDDDDRNGHCLKEEDFEMLSEKTEGFSGSDISGIVQDALMEPVRTMQSATHFKKVFKNENNNNEKEDDYILLPCSPNDPKGIEMKLLDISSEEESKVSAEPLKLSHFLRILQSAKPSVGKEDIKRHMDWTKQFGQEGS